MLNQVLKGNGWLSDASTSQIGQQQHFRFNQAHDGQLKSLVIQGKFEHQFLRERLCRCDVFPSWTASAVLRSSLCSSVTILAACGRGYFQRLNVGRYHLLLSMYLALRGQESTFFSYLAGFS